MTAPPACPPEPVVAFTLQVFGGHVLKILERVPEEEPEPVLVSPPPARHRPSRRPPTSESSSLPSLPPDVQAVLVQNLADMLMAEETTDTTPSDVPLKNRQSTT